MGKTGITGYTGKNMFHVVKPGENAYRIAREAGTTLKKMKTANPKRDLNKLKAGEIIVMPPVITAAQPKKTATAPIKKQSNKFAAVQQQKKPAVVQQNRGVTTKPPEKSSLDTTSIFTQSVFSSPDFLINFGQPVLPQKSGIMTLSKYSANLSPEAKLLKPFTKKREGKVTSIYVAPEGKSTIGHGHLLINKPQFIIDIEKKNLTQEQKQIKIEAALANDANKKALKASLTKDLIDAIKTTGIKNIPSTVNDNLELTNEQVELLFCSDVKKAQTAMEKQIGKANLTKRTTNQKLVVLDLCFNIGGNLKSKIPSFVQHFKAGNMDKAQEELNVFKSDGKILLGLLRRSYNRMLLLNNGVLTNQTQQILLTSVNEYSRKNNKKQVRTFKEAEKILKQR